MDIYIKPIKKTNIVQRRIVYLEDIAEVYAPQQYMQKLSKLPILSISSSQEETYLVSVLDLVQKITQCVQNATVSNLGETDILIEYHPKPKQTNPWILWGKILFISSVLFFGAATTIMCFHSDTQIPLIFQNYYKIFLGENQELPPLLTIPYSIGLVVGIAVFFNHFSKLAMSKDPTPIEVEMTTYEDETIRSTIEQLSRKQKEKNK